MTSLALPRDRVLGDLLPGDRARDVALVIGGAVFVGGGAQLSVSVPGTPVPVTGQKFAVLVTGAALGPGRGFARMALYVVAGGLGVPWFAEAGSGWGGASFGYLVGFILAAAVVGRLAAGGGDRTPARTVATMVLGTVLIYALGVPWLMASLDFGLGAGLRLGVRPFLVGDALKVLVAAGILPGVWRLVGRQS